MPSSKTSSVSTPGVSRLNTCPVAWTEKVMRHRRRSCRLRRRRAGRRRQCTVDHCLRLFQHAVEVLLATEALGVNLVDVFGARGTCGEPAAVGHHFQAGDGCAIAWRAVEYAADGLARQFGLTKLVGRMLRETPPLLRRGNRLHAALG